PYSAIYDLAREKLGNPPKNKICALGDALHTDIRGACDYGIDGIWALTGIHWEELRYEHNPGMPDMTRVIQAIAQSPHKPAATITGFSW
ncbi:MAG: TIGR01459 family HAD-type hydrolase, partial [Micavibrio aeruginosavorus]